MVAAAVLDVRPPAVPLDAARLDAAQPDAGRLDVQHRTAVLFEELATLEPGPARRFCRRQLIELHLTLAEFLARRFRNRGEPLEDLTQVAMVGLIKAVDGFDTGRGVDFSSYAIPTVVGELKRHFRDKGWSVRVPRRLQELKGEITRSTARLTQDLGRAPTVADLAGHLGISAREVLEGLESASAYSALSLSAPSGGDEQAPPIADSLGDLDPDLGHVEDREALRPLLEELPPREQRIIAMRFFGNMTQTEIAEEIGISQMHVSRLLSRSLRRMRDRLLVDV